MQISCLMLLLQLFEQRHGGEIDAKEAICMCAGRVFQGRPERRACVAVATAIGNSLQDDVSGQVTPLKRAKCLNIALLPAAPALYHRWPDGCVGVCVCVCVCVCVKERRLLALVMLCLSCLMTN